MKYSSRQELIVLVPAYFIYIPCANFRALTKTYNFPKIYNVIEELYRYECI